MIYVTVSSSPIDRDGRRSYRVEIVKRDHGDSEGRILACAAEPGANTPAARRLALSAAANRALGDLRSAADFAQRELETMGVSL